MPLWAQPDPASTGAVQPASASPTTSTKHATDLAVGRQERTKINMNTFLYWVRKGLKCYKLHNSSLKRHRAGYHLALLQFISSTEQVLLFGVFGNGAVICVCEVMWGQRKCSKGKEKVCPWSQHPEASPRYKPVSGGGGGGNGAERGTSHQKSAYLRMLPGEHTCQWERKSSPSGQCRSWLGPKVWLWASSGSFLFTYCECLSRTERETKAMLSPQWFSLFFSS